MSNLMNRQLSSPRSSPVSPTSMNKFPKEQSEPFRSSERERTLFAKVGQLQSKQALYLIPILFSLSVNLYLP